MDAPSNTSLILLTAVVLWLGWVVPFLLRRRKAQAATAGADPAGVDPAMVDSLALRTTDTPSEPQRNPQQETSMTSSTPHARPTVEHGQSMDAGPSPAAEAPLHIRWDRTILALVGVAALLTAVIAGVLSLFSAAPGALVLTAFLVFVAVVVGLRALAVRDRKRKVDDAFRDAMGAPSTTANAGQEETPPLPVVRQTAVFDRAAGAEPEAKPVHKPLTAEELRRAALAVAARGTADAKLAHTQTLAEGQLSGSQGISGETWEPVEVPKPQYVLAARAAAAEAEPLTVPATPKASGTTSIRADQAGVGNGPAATSGHALSNLDDVLQRRRA